MVAQIANKAKDEMMAGVRDLRESIAMHSSQPACAGCHLRLDPVALSFEIFDPVGRLVAKDPFSGKAPEVSGKLEGIGDVAPSFANAGELMRNLANSNYFTHCVTRRYLEYTFGELKVEPTRCEASRAYAKVKESGFKMKTLFESLSTLKSAIYRKTN